MNLIRNLSAVLLVSLSPSAARADFRPALARMELDRGQIAPGGAVQATYTFRSNGPSPSDMIVFVHVVRPDGQRIGADFDPDVATTQWPADRFIQEGPQPIVVPDGSPPGKYRVLVGMFSPTGGPRVELDNADRHQGEREYLAGEFEVLAVGAKSEAKPARFECMAVDQSKLLKPPAVQPGEKTLDRIVLSIDRKVLRPVREHEGTGKLALTACYSDGSSHVLACSEAKMRAWTKAASGNVGVVTIEGDKVVAKEGGIATVEAVVRRQGRRFKATLDVVVAPFYRDYHQILVMKLFLGMEGQPVERLADDVVFRHKNRDALCTFEEALEVIRKADNLTRGIPKIIYLVGWQKGGHDHGYPAWAEAGVNPRLKRPQDATALESLRWLIREARKLNTTVSLHINMVDAYRHSPLWDEYAAKDCFAKDSNGQLLAAGIQVKGDDMYNVVYPKEWEAGLAQRRIDRLIQMIPELKEGHTIHVDVFVAQRDGGRPISPWHAKPENGELTPDKYVETQRKIFHYWRDRGFDVTGEGIFWAHPPGEGFTGLQAMSWWYPGDPGYQMQIPEYLMARGRTDRGGDGDFRFGSSMHGEEIWQNDKDKMPGFLGMFCRTTLPWYYLSRLERKKFENNVLYYSDGVVAGSEGGKNLIRKGPFILRENDDLFVPALWHEKEIIAYSREGYEKKSWQLPTEWNDVRNVDLHRISMEGCLPLKRDVPVTGGRLVLSVGKEEAISIVPAGHRMSEVGTKKSATVPAPSALALHRSDVNVLMADRAERGGSASVLKVWGKPEGRAWVENWRRPQDFFQWHVEAEEAGRYEVSVLAEGSDGAEAEIASDAGRITFRLPQGWDKLTLPGPLAIPKGRSVVKMRLLKPDNAKLKSLELVNALAGEDIRRRIRQLRASTEWLRDARYGLMFQWGGWGYPQHGPKKPWPKMIDDFDVETFARMAEDAGAGYVIWSATWCSYHFPAPIKAIDRIAPGHTSQRDLVGDLADALAKRNIRLLLYYHEGHPDQDWWPKNWDYADPDRKQKFVNNLCEVLTEVGQRYGKKLSGWFLDDGMLFYPAPFERITRALKAGNPDRLVSYNSWVLPRLTEFQEVYMGEDFRGGDATPVGGDGIFPSGPQKGLFAHGMFVLDGPDWGINRPDTKINKPCMSADQAVELVKRASARGQTLSFNLLMYEDGSVSPESLEVLRGLRKAIRKGTK